MMRLKDHFPKFIISFLLIVLSAGCSSRPAQDLQKYSESAFLMGTVVNLDVCISPEEKRKISGAFKRVWDRLEDIHWRMNVFYEQSEVSKINSSSLAAVTTKADTYQLLERSFHYTKLTEGAFDITVWPLIRLWKEGVKKDVVPEPQAVKAVQQAIGPKNVQLLGNNRVQAKNDLVKIDLGGIAKGYAIDEAARIFRREGLANFFIDAGGDIYAGGHNCEGTPWRIGIRDPRDLSQIIEVVRLHNAAITTSGNYEQYFQIQNEKWSHIINPVTGYPQREVISASVIAPTAEEADAFSTALTVLSHPQGTELIDTLGDRYASLIIVRQGEERIVKHASEQYKKFQLKR